MSQSRPIFDLLSNLRKLLKGNNSRDDEETDCNYRVTGVIDGAGHEDEVENSETGKPDKKKLEEIDMQRVSFN